MAKKLVKTIFCANDQIEIAHDLGVSQSGEVVATCTQCGRVLKFSAKSTVEEFESQIALHKVQNEGQVTQESINNFLELIADKEENE